MRYTAVVVGVMVAACGGGDGGGGDPLPPDEIEDLCADACDHAVSCGWETDGAACRAECASTYTIWRGEGLRLWVDCLLRADCGQGPIAGEACYIEATVNVDARPVHHDFVTACDQARAACPTTALNGCDLQEVILFSDDYMTGQVLPCFDLACDALSACLEEKVLDAF